MWKFYETFNDARQNIAPPGASACHVKRSGKELPGRQNNAIMAVRYKKCCEY